MIYSHNSLDYKPKTPGQAGRLVSGNRRELLSRLNLKTGFFDGFNHLRRRKLVGTDGQNLVGVGGVDLPVADAGFLVQRRSHSLDAAAAIDVGFKLERFHDELVRWGQG